MSFPSITYNVFTNNFDYTGVGGGGGGSLTSLKVDNADEFNFFPGAGTIVPNAGVAALYGDNGITIIQNINDPSVAQVRFTRGFTTTTSNESVLALDFDIVDDTTQAMQILVAGYCASLQQGLGGTNWVTVINNGGVAAIIDQQDNIINAGPDLQDADFTFVTTGSHIQIFVKGSTGHPIEWTVCTPGRVST